MCNRHYSMPNANAVRSARLPLCQESKDDDAVAVKPLLASGVLPIEGTFGRNVYL